MKNLMILLLTVSWLNVSGQDFEKDVYPTELGDLTFTFIGHGSFMMEWDGQVIHVDPSTREADYTTLPDADLILITHHHGDHCDPSAVAAVEKSGSTVLLTALAKESLGHGTVLPNDETATFKNFTITAIPAYNLVHKRDHGDPFHPKGTCNSYVIEGGGMRIFIGGDTENTPEMKALKDIDIAFLPMNLPYTMTPEMVADAARGFKPDVLYPYHYGSTDPAELVALLKDLDEVNIKVRKMP
ncbi:MBL fold metallo-hydrolase [Fulvivirga sedimenti]|uniref:MBL fold metallo-hydrolase n=1 Tax=Fulvivirga sedimenti TaxID=2879465 RepID=A0A9X1HUB9_9BACT|nr:MBL fold metallo-hydrolase [Fulvivirga sedimenti]MCA6078444.1 MBL fold metallo-hydrolase [Fulvivirga sedimenti]